MSTPSQKYATRVIDAMYEKDDFSQWLGIERLEEDAGYAKIRMTIRKEMTNGFDIAHGGITFSFADSAFAFASNSRGIKSVSIETSISHTAPLHVGDVIIATAKEENLTRKIGVYTVNITNQDNKVVALFKGTVYRTGKEWFTN